MSQKAVETEGVVMEVLPNAMFMIKLQGGRQVLAYTAGSLRQGQIKVLCGDRVRVVLSPYDLTKGRVVYRYNQRNNEDKSIR